MRAFNVCRGTGDRDAVAGRGLAGDGEKGVRNKQRSAEINGASDVKNDGSSISQRVDASAQTAGTGIKQGRDVVNRTAQSSAPSIRTRSLSIRECDKAIGIYLGNNRETDRIRFIVRHTQVPIRIEI